MKKPKHYQEKFRNHFEDGIYQPETEQALERMVKVGRVSAETCLEIIEVLEADHLAKISAANGLPAPDWYAEHDRVFMPGEIGGVPTVPTMVE